MDASLIVIGSLLFFYFFGYRFYGKLIEKKLVSPDERPTPAFSMEDGVDFVPAKKPILF